METDTVSIETFVRKNRIELTSEYANCNPNMDGSADMDNYKVTLTRREYTGKHSGARKDGTAIVARMTTYFSKGIGHHGAEPTAEEVLECLASDAAGIENGGSFDDWCSEYGYDTDSRKALKVFKACEHSAARLRRFLGADLFKTLLYKVEN